MVVSSEVSIKNPKIILHVSDETESSLTEKIEVRFSLVRYMGYTVLGTFAGSKFPQVFFGVAKIFFNVGPHYSELSDYYINSGIKNIAIFLLSAISPELEAISMTYHAGKSVYKTYLEQSCYEKALEHIQTTGETSFDIECDYIL